MVRQSCLRYECIGMLKFQISAFRRYLLLHTNTSIPSLPESHFARIRKHTSKHGQYTKGKQSAFTQKVPSTYGPVDYLVHYTHGTPKMNQYLSSLKSCSKKPGITPNNISFSALLPVSRLVIICTSSQYCGGCGRLPRACSLDTVDNTRIPRLLLVLLLSAH